MIWYGGNDFEGESGFVNTLTYIGHMSGLDANKPYTFKNGKMRGLLHAGIKVAFFLFVVPATAPRGRVIDCTAKNTHVP